MLQPYKKCGYYCRPITLVSKCSQESDDDCSSLDSCGDGGNMGVPDSRGHSPSPTLSDPTKQQLNGMFLL